LRYIYRLHIGKPGGILVAQAPTRTMNPSLPECVVDEALERDPEAARAEYMAEFHSDLETFLFREVVDAAVRISPLPSAVPTSFTTNSMTSTAVQEANDSSNTGPAGGRLEAVNRATLEI